MVFLAALESSHCGRDLSFNERRSFFGNHSLSFGSGLCAALGYTEAPKQHYRLRVPAHARRLSR
jgi:hypothetical protein